MPVLRLPTPCLHHGTPGPSLHRNIPAALQLAGRLQGDFLLAFLRARGEGGAVQKGHCSLLSSLAGSSIPVRSRCIPRLELAGHLASHLPRGTTVWRSHPNLSAPSMRYLGIQHQKRLSLESSSMNGLSCECWRGESVFALIIISHSFSLSLPISINMCT